jgi:tetratricopeptide (TPR) repeat protein
MRSEIPDLDFPDFDIDEPAPPQSAGQKIIRRACVLGLCLVCALSGGLAYVILASGGDLLSPIAPREEPFTRKLREYDVVLAGSSSRGDKVVTARLNRLLDSLEKDAEGMDAQLSVLKRRRALAREDLFGDALTAYRQAYLAAAERVVTAFPYSDIPSAIAAEAAILQARAAGSLSDEEFTTKLEGFASRITSPALASLAPDLYILSGALENPRRALNVPSVEETLSRLGGASAEEQFIINAALIRILKGDISGAGAYVRSLIDQADGAVTRKGVFFAAEFFYDFGDPRRAAEILSRYTDEESLARQADALWLTGSQENARNLWLLLVSPTGESAVPDPQIRSRALYNLASSAPTRTAEVVYLEQLLGHEPRHVYGIIRYTRLQNAARAIALLEDSGLLEDAALLDLERHRRKQDGWNIDRMIPETWLLLDRHHDDPRIYQWAAYYFDLQRRYGETSTLLRQARRNGVTGSWLSLHEGLGMIRQGRLSEGLEMLNTVSVSSPAGAPASSPGNAGLNASWQVYANIGRVLEAERSYTAALNQYETAVPWVTEEVDAAKIQFRISRCLRALGRERESRRVLEYARSLDPENLTIRLELGRSDTAP